MRPRPPLATIVLLVFFALTTIACGGSDTAPPFDELTLRDALGASPEVIARLSPHARRALANRLEAARATQHDHEPVPAGEASATTVESEVRTVDATRLSRGSDVLVLARAEHAPSGATLHAWAESAETLGDSRDPLPPMENATGGETAALEARAIDGKAGAILVDLLKASGAQRLVRVTQWPVAAIASGEVIYVNAGWLVAMSALEDDDAGALHRPTMHTASIRGNPYNTYASLSACTTDVGTRCGSCVASGVGCDEKAVLTDFSDGRSECAWLTADSSRIAQLCAVALMSISSVASCVQERSGCSIPGAANTKAGLSAANTFLSNPNCLKALDACLSGEGSGGGVVFVDAGGGGSSSPPPSTEGCKDPFSACSSSFKGCDNACKSGTCSGAQGDSCKSGSSCTTCSSCDSKNDSCGCGKSGSSSGGSGSSGSSGSKSGCGSSSGSSGGSSSSCGKCEAQRPTSPIAPFVPPAALLAPLLYLVVRGRRVR